MRTWQKYTWPQTQLQRPRSALKFVFVVCCVNTDPTIDRCAWRCVVSLSTRMYPWFRERSVALVTARLGSKQRAHARRTIHTYNIGYISLFFYFLLFLNIEPCKQKTETYTGVSCGIYLHAVRREMRWWRRCLSLPLGEVRGKRRRVKMADGYLIVCVVYVG